LRFLTLSALSLLGLELTQIADNCLNHISALLLDTGSRLIAPCLDRGHAVTARVRDPSKLGASADRVRVVTGDALDAASVDAA
jgi:hypothetical protein